jgi:hypothetical protein
MTLKVALLSMHSLLITLYHLNYPSDVSRRLSVNYITDLNRLRNLTNHSSHRNHRYLR